MRRAEIIWTVVVGGGSGQRFGGAKQYDLLGDERVIDHSCRTARLVSDGVVVVVPGSDAVAEGAVAGGATRSASVRAGLAHVPDEATIICVHDAARPLATVDIYERVIHAVSAGADAAVPGIDVSDTIKIVTGKIVTGKIVTGKIVTGKNATGGNGAAAPGTDGSIGLAMTRRVVQTPDRSTLVAVQTPQAFRASVLRRAHADNGDATDDAALIEQAGGTVVVVDGSIDNRKITVPDDLTWARARLGSR